MPDLSAGTPAAVGRNGGVPARYSPPVAGIGTRWMAARSLGLVSCREGARMLERSRRLPDTATHLAPAVTGADAPSSVPHRHVPLLPFAFSDLGPQEGLLLEAMQGGVDITPEEAEARYPRASQRGKVSNDGVPEEEGR